MKGSVIPRCLLVLVVAATVVAAACGTTTPGGVATADVSGRGGQPPWWGAVPAVAMLQGSDSIDIPSDALFPTGSAVIDAAERVQLEEFARDLAPALTTRRGIWTVVGATDSSGDALANLELGEARADAVVQVVVSAGRIDPARIEIASWGEGCPAVDEAAAFDRTQAMAQNRRVVVLPPDAVPPCPIP